MTNPHIKATWLEAEFVTEGDGPHITMFVETDLPLDIEHDRFDSGALDDLVHDAFKMAPVGAKVRLVPKPRVSRPTPGVAGSQSFEG